MRALTLKILLCNSEGDVICVIWGDYACQDEHDDDDSWFNKHVKKKKKKRCVLQQG